MHGKKDIIEMLNARGAQQDALLQTAAQVKRHHIGDTVYLRGLIEYSNVCAKNCDYCGIRRGNPKLTRYTLTGQEVLDAALYAHRENYASIALQSGEQHSEAFTRTITTLLTRINAATRDALGITLSLGEQSEDTLRAWKEEAGARRYLLRIEASGRALYEKIHPRDATHSHQARLDTLRTLRRLNYQVGTGVMIGLPFQTTEDLADDILFFRDLDVDMIGMGPYIEHTDTPLYSARDSLPPIEERYRLALNMIATCRILFKDINIVASTAMQAISPTGREAAILAGANVIMPNLTPRRYRESYQLYQNKPDLGEDAQTHLETRLRAIGHTIGYGQWGDAKHYLNRQP